MRAMHSNFQWIRAGIRVHTIFSALANATLIVVLNQNICDGCERTDPRAIAIAAHEHEQ